MSMPQIDMNVEIALRAETGEVKKQVQCREVDDSLSEWERARMTSKTWSMEQD